MKPYQRLIICLLILIIGFYPFRYLNAQNPLEVLQGLQNPTLEKTLGEKYGLVGYEIGVTGSALLESLWSSFANSFFNSLKSQLKLEEKLCEIREGFEKTTTEGITTFVGSTLGTVFGGPAGTAVGTTIGNITGKTLADFLFGPEELCDPQQKIATEQEKTRKGIEQISREQVRKNFEELTSSFYKMLAANKTLQEVGKMIKDASLLADEFVKEREKAAALLGMCNYLQNIPCLPSRAKVVLVKTLESNLRELQAYNFFINQLNRVPNCSPYMISPYKNLTEDQAFQMANEIRKRIRDEREQGLTAAMNEIVDGIPPKTRCSTALTINGCPVDVLLDGGQTLCLDQQIIVNANNMKESINRAINLVVDTMKGALSPEALLTYLSGIDGNIVLQNLRRGYNALTQGGIPLDVFLKNFYDNFQQTIAKTCEIFLEPPEVGKGLIMGLFDFAKRMLGGAKTPQYVWCKLQLKKQIVFMLQGKNQLENAAVRLLAFTINHTDKASDVVNNLFDIFQSYTSANTQSSLKKDPYSLAVDLEKNINESDLPPEAKNKLLTAYALWLDVYSAQQANINTLKKLTGQIEKNEYLNEIKGLAANNTNIQFGDINEDARLVYTQNSLQKSIEEFLANTSEDNYEFLRALIKTYGIIFDEAVYNRSWRYLHIYPKTQCEGKTYGTAPLCPNDLPEQPQEELQYSKITILTPRKNAIFITGRATQTRIVWLNPTDDNFKNNKNNINQILIYLDPSTSSSTGYYSGGYIIAQFTSTTINEILESQKYAYTWDMVGFYPATYLYNLVIIYVDKNGNIIARGSVPIIFTFTSAFQQNNSFDFHPKLNTFSKGFYSLTKIISNIYQKSLSFLKDYLNFAKAQEKATSTITIISPMNGTFLIPFENLTITWNASEELQKQASQITINLLYSTSSDYQNPDLIYNITTLTPTTTSYTWQVKNPAEVLDQVSQFEAENQNYKVISVNYEIKINYLNNGEIIASSSVPVAISIEEQLYQNWRTDLLDEIQNLPANQCSWAQVYNYDYWTIPGVNSVDRNWRMVSINYETRRGGNWLTRTFTHSKAPLYLSDIRFWVRKLSTDDINYDVYWEIKYDNYVSSSTTKSTTINYFNDTKQCTIPYTPSLEYLKNLKFHSSPTLILALDTQAEVNRITASINKTGTLAITDLNTLLKEDSKRHIETIQDLDDMKEFLKHFMYISQGENQQSEIDKIKDINDLKLYLEPQIMHLTTDFNYASSTVNKIRNATSIESIKKILETYINHNSIKPYNKEEVEKYMTQHIMIDRMKDFLKMLVGKENPQLLTQINTLVIATPTKEAAQRYLLNATNTTPEIGYSEVEIPKSFTTINIPSFSSGLNETALATTSKDFINKACDLCQNNIGQRRFLADIVNLAYMDLRPFTYKDDDRDDREKEGLTGFFLLRDPISFLERAEYIYGKFLADLMLNENIKEYYKSVQKLQTDLDARLISEYIKVKAEVVNALLAYAQTFPELGNLNLGNSEFLPEMNVIAFLSDYKMILDDLLKKINLIDRMGGLLEILYKAGKLEEMTKILETAQEDNLERLMKAMAKGENSVYFADIWKIEDSLEDINIKLRKIKVLLDEVEQIRQEYQSQVQTPSKIQAQIKNVLDKETPSQKENNFSLPKLIQSIFQSKKVKLKNEI